MDNSKGVVTLNDVKTKLILNDDATATIVGTQDIPDSHLKWIDDNRSKSKFEKSGSEFKLLASVPAAIVNKWFREGFDIFDKNNTPDIIMKRLRKEDMEHFIATGDRLF